MGVRLRGNPGVHYDHSTGRSLKALQHGLERAGFAAPRFHGGKHCLKDLAAFGKAAGVENQRQGYQRAIATFFLRFSVVGLINSKG